MKIKTLLAASAIALALPMAAQAQGTVRGAERGAQEGADVGGPIGAVVGGAVGAATGTVGGILGVDDRPRFRSYVRERNVRSYDYDGRVAVGSELPRSGVTYYEVPNDYHVARGTRYTVVNDTPVLVDGRGHIIEVLN
ncbi:DUF1236 domain-containing protein [Methylobacterium brachythecii]|uniref:DUF1236 domain-containing protein n=1 Tax=Methylobacterium brachythecii TaxID=1176177 RepID=A0A7W6F4T5_9HYPH|nr:DUF1236 domain-containing protein [Methylobacterium brachythecii]MBB3900725.1 hypothetical protein [Methylobacterium brachythecii]GLS46585.1 hypothetical protein GCM10007884_45790 [Methylobacterium brachythecii]